MFCRCYIAEVIHSNIGERVWLTWTASEFTENFRIVEVDRCIAGSREAQENDKPPVGTSHLSLIVY